MARPTKYEQVRKEERRARVSISRNLAELDDIKEKLEDNSLSAPQVSALRLRADISLALLKKRLPDLQATQLDATVTDNTAESMSDAKLIAIAGGKAS